MSDPTSPSPLLTAAGAIGEAEAGAVALAHWGLRAGATRLTGEKDQIFRLDAGKRSCVLRIAHPEEAAAEIELTTQALLHVAAVDPELPVERPVAALDGSLIVPLELGGEARLARMTSLLPGQALREVEADEALRRRLGATYARLGLALARFSHPAAARVMLWDIRQAPLARPLAEVIEASGRRAALREVFDRFDGEVSPRLEPLRCQFLHNDLTGANVFVGPTGTEVSGLIDFGDSTVTQLINDVAVGATELLIDGPDPLGLALEMVAAYHRVSPLEAEEVSLLFDLVRTRTAMLIAITEWRAERFPENRAYIARKTPRAWRLLEALTPDAAGAFAERAMIACGYR